MGCSKERGKPPKARDRLVEAVSIFDGPVVEGPDEREDREVRIIAFGTLGPRVIAVVLHMAR